MIVYKFGGASVRNKEAFTQVEKIIRKAGDTGLVIILSAMGKTTNALERIVQNAHSRQPYDEELKQIRNYHFEILDGLGLEPSGDVTRLFGEIEEACLTAWQLSFDKAYDKIVSYGEKISSSILHHYLTGQGLEIKLLDSASLIHCSGRHREGRIEWKKTEDAIKSAIPPSVTGCWLAQGFIGSMADGAAVTLGREGSDYTASIFAAALRAESVTIWKDVPGVLNADPNEEVNTRLFTRMPYNEAIEMAYYGAKVIHPKTIKPLENNKIPLFVKSFDHPDENGTRISSDPELVPRLCGVIRKKHQILFTLRPRDLSFINETHVQSVMGMLSDAGIRTNLMQSTAIHFSFLIDDTGKETIEDISRELSGLFTVRYNHELSLLTLRHYSQEDITLYTRNYEAVVEQRTRITYQAVLREMA